MGRIVGHGASLISISLVLLTVGCGGGGTGSNSQSAPVLNLAGNWQASTHSALGFDTFLSGTLTQTGNQISGTMNINGSPCAISGMLSGTVSGSSVTLSLVEGLQSVSLTGTATPDGNSMTGTYQAPLGGCLNGDSGTFVATRTTSNAACAAVPPGIVSWWQGEGNAQDATGTNPGLLQGNVTFVPGEVGQAFNFDGSTGYVNVPDSPSLQSITTTVSVEMWVLPQPLPSGGYAYMYARRDPLTSENFSIYILDDGTLTILLRTTSSPTETGSKFASAPGTVTFGHLQHIAATANATTSSVKAYVNGVTIPLTLAFGPGNFSGTFSPVTHLYLGRREDASVEGQTGAAYFPGELDEISLYSTELSQSQIQTIVNAGSAGKCH